MPPRQTSFDVKPPLRNPNEAQEYVCGFMITATKSEVVLILKSKPDWQAGFLNGVGGKIEPNEQPLDAMIREFKEETGVDHDCWHRFCVLEGRFFKVHFYHSFTEKARSVETVETEQIYLCKLDQLHELKVLPNLRWLIPMALDGGFVTPVHIERGEDGGLVTPVQVLDSSLYHAGKHEGV